MADLSGARTLGGSSGAEKWQLTEGDTLGGYRASLPRTVTFAAWRLCVVLAT